MGIKKIIQIGDIHIRNVKMHDLLEDAFSEFYKIMMGLRKQYEYDELRIVICGDLFHQKITVSNEQILLAHKFLTNCVNFSPVIIIAGNHDLLENNKERVDSITPIVELLNNDKITYFKNSGCYLDNNVVWCVYSIHESNKSPDIETSKLDFGLDKKYIGLFHGDISGAIREDGYELSYGVSDVYFKGCDLVLSGHIHKRQVIQKNGYKIIYCSSLIQQRWSESVSEHGVVIVDLETLGFEFVDINIDYGLYKYEINGLEDLDTDNIIFLNK